jgi:hypothetical protein
VQVDANIGAYAKMVSWIGLSVVTISTIVEKLKDVMANVNFTLKYFLVEECCE